MGQVTVTMPTATGTIDLVGWADDSGKVAIAQIPGEMVAGAFVPVGVDNPLHVTADSSIPVPSDPGDDGKSVIATAGAYELGSPFASQIADVDFLIGFPVDSSVWTLLAGVEGLPDASRVLVDQSGSGGPDVGLYTLSRPDPEEPGSFTLTTALADFAAYTVLTCTQIVGGTLGPVSESGMLVPYVVGVGPIVQGFYDGQGLFKGLGLADVPLAAESYFDQPRFVKGYTFTALDPTLYSAPFDNSLLPVLDNGVTAAPGDFIATLATVTGGTMGGVDADSGDNWIAYVNAVDGSNSQLLVSPGSAPNPDVPHITTNPLVGGCMVTTLNGYRLVFSSDSRVAGPDTFRSGSHTAGMGWLITPPGPYIFATATDDTVGQDGNLAFVVSGATWHTKSAGAWS